MLRRSRLFIVVWCAFFALSSCRSAQKMVESGDYDSAVDYCVSKLQGKRKKKDKYVQGLELAFRKATERDMRAADQLVAENRPENWERIHGIYRQIRLRQDQVYPLLPLTSEDGYQAKFMFVNVENLENESRQKAAAYLYERAQKLLQQGREGDKQAARTAWNTLRDLEQRYYRNYEDKDRLLREARALGSAHILFEVGNKSDKVLPRAFYDRIMAMGAQDLNSEWKVFYFNSKDLPEGVKADYRVVFNLRRVDISPERIHERSYTDEKEIEDGWEYALDERGNVRKDTNGNDIKYRRYVRIRAQVIEAMQTKAARLSGTVEVFDVNRESRLDMREIGAEVMFEHYASTFTGDARALCDQSRNRIGSRPVPFPPDADMLAQAADRLKPTIRSELQNNRALHL